MTIRPGGAGFHRAKFEPTKKRKVQMIEEANEKVIRGVKFADERFFNEEDEIWQNEDGFSSVGCQVLGGLTGQRTNHFRSIDGLADEVEVNRLSCSKILVASEERLRGS